jgi:hypothetical protein
MRNFQRPPLAAFLEWGCDCVERHREQSEAIQTKPLGEPQSLGRFASLAMTTVESN